MNDVPRKKSAPRSMPRSDAAQPRPLRPVGEAWGAAPMPPAENSSRRRVAIVAIGGASLATAAALALFMTRTTCTTNLDHSSDDWMSVVKRQVLPVTDMRTAGDIGPPETTGRHVVELPQPKAIADHPSPAPPPFKDSK